MAFIGLLKVCDPFDRVHCWRNNSFHRSKSTQTFLAALDAIKDEDEDLCGSVSRTTGESNFEFIKSPIKSGGMKCWL